MNKTIYEEGIEKGMEKASLKFVFGLLEHRFGPLTPELRNYLEQLPTGQLMELTLQIGRAGSLADLALPTAIRQG